MPNAPTRPALLPDVASLGYGLLLATNTTCMWGGLFPFLPPELRMSGFVFGFYLAISLCSALFYLAAATRSYRHAATATRLRTRHAVVPYAAGWGLIIGSAYLDTVSLPLAVGGGALLSLGMVAFFLLWQRIFANADPARGNLSLLKGTLLAGPIYLCLLLLPETITTYLIPLVFLPLFALATMLKSRGLDPEQPMFQDEPRAHRREYARVLQETWKSIFCVGGLGFCSGIMRSLSVLEADVGAFVNLFSMLALSCGAAVLLLLWHRKSLRMSVVLAYRRFFPFVITAFLALPFLGTPFATWMAGILYALYSIATIIMTIQCAQLSREDGINPLFIYGVFGGVATLLQNIGFIAGGLADTIEFMSFPPLLLTALVACYLLAIIFFIEQGAFRRETAGTPGRNGIELVRATGTAGGARVFRTPVGDHTGKCSAAPSGQTAQNPTPAREHHLSAGDGDIDIPGQEALGPHVETLRSEASNESRRGKTRHQYRDRISKQAEAVRIHYGLSGREAEVVELLVRGYSVPHIAEELVLSENTIRTHAKAIYKKLDVHRKQDLLDLVGSFETDSIKH